MILKKTTWLFVLMICFAIFIHAAPVLALELNIKNYPAIPAPIPGGKFDLDCISGAGGRNCDIIFEPSVSNIILFIFVASIWLGSIIAFVVLVYTGFTFIFSGENPGIRSKAKERITNIIWGMLILLLSTVALKLINPDITELKEPTLKAVDPGSPWKLILPGLRVGRGGGPSGGGGGGNDVGCGTPYNPSCHSKAKIQDEVFKQLKSALPEDIALHFFNKVIPCESGWNPAAEAKGVDCMAVGLYQLRDPTRPGIGGVNNCTPGATAKDMPWWDQTKIAAEIFNSSSSGYKYWGCW